MRTDDGPLQRNRLPIERHVRVWKSGARRRPAAQPPTSLGDYRARSISDTKLRDEAECDRAQTLGREHLWQKASHDVVSNPRHGTAGRQRACEEGEDTIGISKEGVTYWPPFRLV